MKKLQFKIEQFAICPQDPNAAMELLTDMGAEEWARDHVLAKGAVYGQDGLRNEADLSFNYELAPAGVEFELLNYTQGVNWMDLHAPRVSHLGMHCSAEELVEWRAFFAERGIKVAQEVLTQAHTNPHIAGKRWYNYVIFDTYDILGVDVKFIVRRDAKE